MPSRAKKVMLVFALLCLTLACDFVFLPDPLLPTRSVSVTILAATIRPSDTPTDTPTFSPTDTEISPPAPQIPGEPVVTLVLFPVKSSPTYTGQQVEVVLDAIPERLSLSRKSDGSIESVSSPWTDFTVTEMQVCFSFENPCTLGGPWIPFVLSPDSVYFGGSARQKYTFQIDWIGPRTLWAVAQFRDASKQPVQSFSSTFSSEAPQTISQIALQINGVVNEATPVTAQPMPVQTIIAVTRSAFPVTGSVQLAGGASATGGVAGDTIQIQAAFTSTSPDGVVKLMRVKPTSTCRTEHIQMDDAAWEPFTSTRSFPVTLAINWIGFYVAAQFQDEKGNLSAVYCDDISVEGMPPTSIGTP